jgi:NitT/TauT family transport system substrate-binding protein
MRSSRRGRRSPAVHLGVAALTCTLGLAACGSGGGSASGGSSQQNGLTSITVGVIPIIDVAPIYLGIKQGFFRKAGLKVVPQPAQGGSAIIPAVVSGHDQFGFSNNTSLITASSKGLPVTVVTAGVNAGTDVRNNYAGVLVRGDSPIHSFAQLSGKTIAVNDLENVGPLAINAAIEKDGGNYKTVRYLAISFPSMAAPLRNRQVDALWEVQPFTGLFEHRGYNFRFIGDPMVATAPMFPVSSYFTTASYAKANPKIVTGFRNAMNQSLTYAQQHPSAVRKILLTYTKITAPAAQAAGLPTWTTNPEVKLLHATANYAQQFGYISTPPNWVVLLSGLGPGTSG